LCERLAGEQIEELMKKVEEVPEEPVLPLNNGPNILEVTKRALKRAGYNLDDYFSQ
jgi:hypothetical protein